MSRSFRTAESYEAERKTRGMLANFLYTRGFTEVRDERISRGQTETQVIHAKTTQGQELSMLVRLCWRYSTADKAAAQLLARIKNDDWEGTIRSKLERERERGATHYLIVDRDGEQIRHAALVPISEILRIWCAQRDVSELWIRRRRSGRRTKNHAMNGSSPTIWIKDSSTSEVSSALWDHPDVWDIASMESEAARIQGSLGDDTFDDIHIGDYSSIGSDTPEVQTAVRSFVKRDRRVRAAVLDRAERKCERERCGVSRPYDGFLDVHHILGAEKSDRSWNCVALCPNCHREAHFAPDHDQINENLLRSAMHYRPPNFG